MDSPQTGANFATTRWSMVLRAARGQEPHAPRALEELCAAYWFPLYAFIRRQGWSPHDAEDLTQEFFARMLEKQMLANVGPEKGKFRTFLMVCAKRFLANEHERRNAAKRGGGMKPVAFDAEEAEGRYVATSAEATPEEAFERKWAMTVLENALKKLSEEFVTRGKEKLFNSIKVYLAADEAAPSYAKMAEQMGVTEAAVKVAVHRLRARFRAVLEEEIASTLSSPEELGEEIEYLMRILSN
jgi:RNA polymerase sigma factor (sigma-70 family)